MAVKTGVMGSSEPALVFPVIASLCSLQGIQTLKTKPKPKRNTGKCFARPAKILRGMQSYVPKRNTGKCLLTVGTDVKTCNTKIGLACMFLTKQKQHPLDIPYIYNRIDLGKRKMCKSIPDYGSQ